MNNDEFKRYILERLDKIDKRLAKIEQEVATLNTHWRWVKGLLALLISITTILISLMEHIKFMFNI